MKSKIIPLLLASLLGVSCVKTKFPIKQQQRIEQTIPKNNQLLEECINYSMNNKLNYTKTQYRCIKYTGKDICYKPVIVNGKDMCCAMYGTKEGYIAGMVGKEECLVKVQLRYPIKQENGKWIRQGKAWETPMQRLDSGTTCGLELQIRDKKFSFFRHSRNIEGLSIIKWDQTFSYEEGKYSSWNLKSNDFEENSVKYKDNVSRICERFY